ncbi:MAG: tetratricopeptide repeat protein [Bacteroidaceae bacterium]|nr:tetratricopeptide repeat protein [Bacteroidaceae bacterium]
MRKKVIVICLLAATSFVGVNAQVTYEKNRPVAFFEQGKAMFENKNYVGCVDQLTQFKKESKDRDLIQEADFMIASSAYETNKFDAQALLQSFCEQYTWSRHIDKAKFMIANLLFFDNNYEQAISAYTEIPMERLSTADQEDYCFRLGLSYMKTNQLEKAKPFFAVLGAQSDKYAEASLFYNAYIRYIEGDYNKALGSFLSLENSAEFAKPSSYYAAQIYFVRNDYGKVIPLAQQLLKNYPDDENNAELYRLLGESYYQQGNDAKAIEYLTKYTASTSSPMRNSVYMLGVAQYRAQNYSQAIKWLSKATKGDDVLMQNAYLYLAQSYLHQGDKKNAQLAFDVASRFEFDPQVQEVALYNYALSVHETSFSPFNESVLVFERFLNKFPNSRYADQTNDYLVEVYLTTKNYRTALESINKIKKPNSKILEAKQRILFQLGTELFANSDFQQAQANFTEAINMGNYDREIKAQSYFWRGECYYRMGNFAAAASDYLSYLSATQERSKNIYGLAQYDLAYAYYKQNQFDRAVTWFLKYVNENPNGDKTTVSDAYNRIGDCYFYNRNFAQAESYYARAVEVTPSAADYAMFQKGFVAGLQKDYKTKINAMNNLIAQYPQSEYVDDALFEKGRSYIQIDDDVQAEAAFKQILQQFPQSAVARKAGIQLGMLYFNRNDLDQATVAYKKVISDYPGSEEARVAVQDLKSVYLDKNDIDSYAAYVKSLGGNVQFAAGEQDSLTYLAAEKLYFRGNLPEAERSLRRYLQSFEGGGAFGLNAHYYLGSIYFTNKNYAQALPEYEQVLQISDNKFEEDALARVAEIYYLKNDYEKALNYFKTLDIKAQSADNKLAAKLGIIRMSRHLNNNDDVILTANKLLEDNKLSPELMTEARYERAMALKNLKQMEKAAEDWKILSKDTRNVYGAESNYQLGQYYFDNGKEKDAEKLMIEFIEVGTPHQYWLARGFVLLADIYIKAGDSFQAKQYLLNLKNNYQGEDDIAGMIEERLSKIGE